MVASASRGSPHRRIKHSRKGQTEERLLERGQEVISRGLCMRSSGAFDDSHLFYMMNRNHL